MQFSELKFIPELLQALAQQHYVEPTPIQAQAIPWILAGRDVMGIAQTGTGKTAAFTLPILQGLYTKSSVQSFCQPQALILTPTRELAAQTLKNFRRYGSELPLSYGAIFGGVNEGPQIRMLQEGVDVLVATTGRFLDLYRRNYFKLDGIRYLVLDEADRMLDMGFLPEVRRILQALPERHQTLLFSATLPQEIEVLVQDFLKNPVRIEITPPATVATTVEQGVLFIPKGQKLSLLQHILMQDVCERVIVFSRTKFGTERIGRFLRRENIQNRTLHGDKTQRERLRALRQFRDGTVKVLIATDVASRGLDVSEVTHVINFDLPELPESYVHRIGRTGRAGKNGVAFSFCDRVEKPFLRAIENQLNRPIPVISARKFWPDFEPQETQPTAPARDSFRRRSHRTVHSA